MSKVSRWAMVAGVAIAAGAAVADDVIKVNDGQTLTEQDLLAGEFKGQQFMLGPGTTFEINTGGVIGPVGDPDPFDFAGSTTNVNNGGLFDSQVISPERSIVSDLILNVLEGGRVGAGFAAAFGSRVTLFGGGIIGNDFRASGNVSVSILGGSMGQNFEVSAQSTAQILGGTVSDFLVADNDSVVNMSGGSVGNFVLADRQSQFNVSGGTLVDGGFLRADRDSTLHLSITDLSLDGDPVDLMFGETVELPEADGALLEGTLADGSPFRVRTFLDRGATLTVELVPAPGTGATLGLLALLASRRRRA